MGKVLVITLCSSIVLVALVAIVIVNFRSIYFYMIYGTTNLMVRDICRNTRDPSECEASLSGVKTEDWEEIIAIKFRLAIEKNRDATEKIAEIEKDKKRCKEFLEIADEDLQRCLNKLFDPNKTRYSDADVMVWITGAMAYQETCIDSFEEKTERDTVMKLMNDPSHLTSDLMHFGHLNYFNVFGFRDTNKTGLNRRLLESSSLDIGHRGLFEDNPEPDVVVALDGSGKFKTISKAIKSAPAKSTKAFIILVKPGVYKENVNVPRHTNGIVLIGSGVANTKVTGDRSYTVGGVSTFDTATFSVDGDFFIAKDITFENTAGFKGEQAVALRVSGNKAVFYNCHIDGYQNTLYAHAYSQFYRDCTISGSIDIITGYAVAVFQNCKMIVKKPGPNQQWCTVAAQLRFDQADVGGFLMQNCIITGEPPLMSVVPAIKSYLARPLKPYSKTFVMQSFIDKNIVPEGWLAWGHNAHMDLCNFREFQNRGPGSDLSKRVRWPGIMNFSFSEIDSRYVPQSFLLRDDWVKMTGIPYEPGVMTDTHFTSSNLTSVT